MSEQKQQTEAADGQSRLTDGLGDDSQQAIDPQNFKFTVQAFNEEIACVALERESLAIQLFIDGLRNVPR